MGLCCTLPPPPPPLCVVVPGLLVGWLLVVELVGYWLVGSWAVEFGWLVGWLVAIWLVGRLCWLVARGVCVSVCAHVL